MMPGSFPPDVLLGIGHGKFVDKVINDAGVGRHRQFDLFAQNLGQVVIGVFPVK